MNIDQLNARKARLQARIERIQWLQENRKADLSEELEERQMQIRLIERQMRAQG